MSQALPAVVPSARAGFRRFVGVGLGGGRGKSTAVARLELGPQGQLAVAEAKLRHGHRGGGREESEDRTAGQAFHDEVLVAYLRRWVDDTTVVAIDAPLTMPPCVRCQLACPGVDACEVPVVEWMRKHATALAVGTRRDSNKPAITPYTQRATELLARRAGLHPRETLGQGMGPLAARAAYLRRALSPQLRLHENLIEAHPRGTLIRLFGARDERMARRGETERVRETRKRMLATLTDTIEFDYVWPEVVVRSGRLFDSVVCAVTAFLWARQDWRVPGATSTQGEPTVTEAADGLADLWLTDGWQWAPPARGA